MNNYSPFSLRPSRKRKAEEVPESEPKADLDPTDEATPKQKSKPKTKGKTKRHKTTKRQKPATTIYPAGIYVDGGQNSQTGDDAWGCVTDETGADLVGANQSLLEGFVVLADQELPAGKRHVLVAHFDGVRQQNNGAELLALVAGLRIALSHGIPPPVYSDSSLMISFWSQGHVNAQTSMEMDPRKLAFIEECAKLRAEFEQRGGMIVKIPGDANPADLGYH